MALVTFGLNSRTSRRTASSSAEQVHCVAWRPSLTQSLSAKLTASAQLNPWRARGFQSAAVFRHSAPHVRKRLRNGSHQV